ncbi:hypothetical protein DL96DRAFT_1710883 [Flagelloscypha sp. PMI_526]|nr:hypothetical protein DL96DRAFT_1710883 [Flagelloscypha sp. PMI_526]
MGCWEIFDLISGVSASGGPKSFHEGTQYEESLAEGLAEKIIIAAQFSNIPAKKDLQMILVDVLAQSKRFLRPWGSWHEPAVVIGKFGENENENDVTIRFCEQYDSYGSFWQLRNRDGSWEDGITEVHEESRPFMDSTCWYYCCSWISLPCRSHKSLEQAIYDTFSKSMHRGCGMSPSLDYGLMGFMCGQCQDPFLENVSVSEALQLVCLDKVPNLPEAISHGFRGKDLAPALFADFQTWIFQFPDVWPWQSNGQFSSPRFQTFKATSSSSPKILSLPLELLLQVMSSLSLVDVINLLLRLSADLTLSGAEFAGGSSRKRSKSREFDTAAQNAIVKRGKIAVANNLEHGAPSLETLRSVEAEAKAEVANLTFHISHYLFLRDQALKAVQRSAEYLSHREKTIAFDGPDSEAMNLDE